MMMLMMLMLMMNDEKHDLNCDFCDDDKDDSFVRQLKLVAVLEGEPFAGAFGKTSVSRVRHRPSRLFRTKISCCSDTSFVLYMKGRKPHASPSASFICKNCLNGLLACLAQVCGAGVSVALLCCACFCNAFLL